MKIVIYLLIIIAMGLIIYNITFLDFSNIFEGRSAVAAIGIMAALCAIVLLFIVQASRKFSNKKR
jgi:hypothetical protein